MDERDPKRIAITKTVRYFLNRILNSWLIKIHHIYMIWKKS
jgi:hypothetical protein